MQRIDSVFLSLLLAWIVFASQGGSISVLPVDSPFPASESWLLGVAESSDMTGLELAMNAKVIRDTVDNRLLLDPDQDATGDGEPWITAKLRADANGGGSPYFIFRDGSRASEGPLPAGLDAMYLTLKTAVGVE